MNTRLLHRNEKEIIRILFRENRPLTIREMSIMAGMSWITAKKYLHSVRSKNLVSEHRAEKRPKYMLSRELLKALHERKRRRLSDIKDESH